MADKTTYAFGTPPETGGSGETGGTGTTGSSGGTGGPSPAYDLAALQVRRSASYTMTTSYSDVTFDTIDIENDYDVIELDDSNTDRILIKEDGLYEISYDFIPLNNNEDAINARIRIDDNTIVPGSQIELSGVNIAAAGISRKCIGDILKGEYLTLQMSSDVAGGSMDQLSLRVVKLDQTVGDTGGSGGSGGTGGTGADGAAVNTGGTGDTGNTGAIGNVGATGGTGDTGGFGDIGATGGSGGTGANDYAGFPNRTDSVISLTGDLFKIEPAITSFDVYAGGKIWNKTGINSLNIADTVGIHFILFDTDGVLKQTTTPWSMTGNAAPVAIVYWNGDNGRLAEERHSHTRNKEWHHWAHDTIGARYGHGLDGTFTDTTISISAGSIYDEDIETEWSIQTNCIIWYRSGLDNMTFINTPSNTPYLVNGNTIRYDDDGVLTDVQANRYVNMWIYGTNDVDNQIYCVLGQNQYSSLSEAQSEDLPTLPISSAEWKLLYRLTYRATSGTPTYIESYDYRVVSSGPAINANSNQFPIASNVLTNTTTFDGILSGTDGTVQSALETLDDHTHLTLTGGTGGTGSTGTTGSTGGTGGTGAVGTAAYDISIPMTKETVTSDSYVVLKTFVFRGSTALGNSPTNFIGVVSQEVSNFGGDLQLYDMTNDLQIANIDFSYSDTDVHKANSSTISNVPTGEAIWQIRAKVDSVGNDIYIQGVHISH